VIASWIPILLAATTGVAGAIERPAAEVDSGPRLPMHLRSTGALASTGDGRGQVIEPAGLIVDPLGRVHVSDAALHRVQRFDPDGRWIGEAGVLGSDPGQLRRPGNVALLGTQGVAVLDRENRRISGYDVFGRFSGVLVDLAGEPLADQVGRVTPVALATDRGGALYVADADRDRVLAFDFSGRYLRTLGGFGAHAGSFRGLAGLAVTPKGELVTVERDGARVQRLDAGGRPVAAWPIEPARSRGALSVAVDDSLRVAVADEELGQVWVFDGAGRPLARLEGLAEPRALAFAGDGELLVAESGRVSRFVLERGRPRPTPKD
jgi:DNA-binding beta-propeller fold protein YncE